MKQTRAGVAALPLAGGTYKTLTDYVALAKPRLNMLVVATSAGGYYLGAVGPLDALTMGGAVAGTALVAGGAAALNQVRERDTDALMRRTRMRPLPDGRVGPREATVFGIVLAAAGIAFLAAATNALATALAVATIGVYILIYTPMKRHSPAATLVGAVPGALPAVIGWAAAHGTMGAGGLVLFLIVFLWQIPHFMAIAWMCRDDYRQAGFPMLPVIEPSGERAGRQALLYTAALLPASVAPTFLGMTGQPYFWIALALGLVMLWLAARFASTRSEEAARRLFFGSITYLSLIWVAMVVFH